MLINFALHTVGTSVSSDKVNTDGYECTNLISENWHLRRKGFLAEHFLKPPVNITFRFPCNVYIHQIVLTPCVGQQQSSHLELLSASRPMSKNINAKKFHNNETAVSTPPGSSASSSHTNSLSTSVSPLAISYPVSRLTVFTSEPVCFFNPKVGTHFSNNYPGDHCQNKVVMQHFKKDLLTASSHITIRILRTVSGSTAAVSNVDIWGMPSILVPATIKENIVKSYKEYINPICMKAPLSSTHDLTNNEHSNKSLGTNGQVEEKQRVCDIPEDFLDSITCEVMAIPMLLPCGKNVDMSTLDRYFNTEASYGRKPRDPFTGVEFSNANKPVPNGVLKARIDHFLMKNSNDKVIGSIPRTVAGAGNTLLGKRKLTGQKVNKGVSSLISDPITESLQANKGDEQKKEMPVINISNTVLPSLDHTSIQRHHIQVNTTQTLTKSESKRASQNDSIIPVTSADFSSHETQLKDSLNLALSAVRSSFSYSSATDACSDVNVENDGCSLCQQILSDNKIKIIKYQIPCGHLICRECLTARSLESSLHCGLCNHSFEKRFAVRKHDK
ncbi:unnamed protein product [Lymnaea stagnalis]|uniref:RING finger protein 37 n=1 Tax=Lymnaea stagnalis TaxID=6523 RepID=A0AAV2I237_LYMST